MSGDNHRLDVLQQQFTVFTGEMNGVLQEMQVTIQGMAKTYSMALQVFHQRITEVERALEESRVGTQIRTEEEGKEL